MDQITLKINRKTGKYEGKGAIPFRNQAKVATRDLSEPATREGPEPGPYRRFIVGFLSGHRYIADLDRSFFAHFGTDFEDLEAAQKLVDAKLSDAEVFRRAIRDFSKQLPIVYERWTCSDQGGVSVIGHVAQVLAPHAPDQRILPQELLTPSP